MAEAIKELLNTDQIGYVCVSNARIRKSDEEAKRNTKAYQELAAEVASPEEIQIDLLTGSLSKRTALENIIETFRQGAFKNSSPKGVIVIHDLSAFGTTAEAVAETYERIAREDIGVLIKGDEHSEFSTVNDMNSFYKKYGIVPTEDTLSEGYKTLFNDIRALTIETKQGRKKKERVFEPAWKKIYWLYESYTIRESQVYKNDLIDSTTKVTFKRWCDAYEQSDEYLEDEGTVSSKDENLDKKPKRYGKVPDEFYELVSELKNGTEFYKACKKVGLPKMSKISYNRYLLKLELDPKDKNGKVWPTIRDEKFVPSRKKVAKASVDYYNEEVARAIGAKVD